MYKIMIVEDDAVIAAEIRDYLCRWDMQGHIAHRLDDIVGEYIRIKPQLTITASIGASSCGSFTIRP